MPWKMMITAPKDREIWVFAPGTEGLDNLQSKCKWHADAGFCIDELRQPVYWMELAEYELMKKAAEKDPAPKPTPPRPLGVEKPDGS